MQNEIKRLLHCLGTNFRELRNMNVCTYAWLTKLNVYISLVLRCYHCQCCAPKFWPLLGAYGLRAGRDLYRAIPPLAQGLALHGLIQRTVPFSRVLRQASGFDRGPILTRILT